jgi:hypothetical protein
MLGYHNTMQVYKGCSGIVPVILSRGIRRRWIVKFTPQLPYLRERTHWIRRLAGPQNQSGWLWKRGSLSPPTRIPTPYSSAQSLSIYRLCYLGSFKHVSSDRDYVHVRLPSCRINQWPNTQLQGTAVPGSGTKWLRDRHWHSLQAASPLLCLWATVVTQP